MGAFERDYPEKADSETEMRLDQVKKDFEQNDYVTVKPGESYRVKDLIESL